MSADFEVQQEPDRLRVRFLVLVAASGVALTIAVSLVPAWVLESRSLLATDGPARASELPAAPSTVSGVHQTLLELDDERRPVDARQRQRALLESYGWVDRAQGLVHIPVEQAFDLLLAREIEEQAPSDGAGP